MNATELKTFLMDKMSMTEIYQPVIIKELLQHGGTRTKDQLAVALADYDLSVKDYYRKIVMRWPKITLTKHNVVDYQRKGEKWNLIASFNDSEELIKICDSKISEWLENKRNREKDPAVNESKRYRVLKGAKSKCELCGIPAQLRPLDIDHIIPQSKADKYGKVVLNGKHILVHSEENLQVLCFKCNRAKRDQDGTDFRKRKKLVRDRIPEIIRSEGRDPIIKTLAGNQLMSALNEKLIEEHEEYLESKDIHELADMVEVILAIAKAKGSSQELLFDVVAKKRSANGGFAAGYFYEGDVA
jgi:predicted house-cleaning noncanonical NTP pyrophosphatase (MazG superfamily)